MNPQIGLCGNWRVAYPREATVRLPICALAAALTLVAVLTPAARADPRADFLAGRTRDCNRAIVGGEARKVQLA